MKDTYVKSILAKWKDLGVDPLDNGFELSENYDSWRKSK
mgnify:FL=1